jgi:fructose-1,6-bisphosphatase/sedoheptulose 1,7-bisphosphatase-like protein
MSDTVKYLYIGKCKCGSIVTAIADYPDCKASTAKEVAKCIKQGLDVSRVKFTDELKKSNFFLAACTCKKGGLDDC